MKLRAPALAMVFAGFCACCPSLHAQGDTAFRIPDLSVYANGAPQLAMARRSRLQIARGVDSAFSDEITSDAPLFVFEQTRERLLVSRFQEAKQLDSNGFWVRSSDCIMWSSRFFYYPKHEGVIPRSFDLMWRLDGSGRKWKSQQRGTFYGYPRVNPLSKSPPVVLYDFGLLSGQVLGTEGATRELLALERPDRYELRVFVTRAELQFVKNRMLDLEHLYATRRDDDLEEAKDERARERAIFRHIDRMASVREAFAAIGFFDMRLYDEWISAERYATLKRVGRVPSAEIAKARDDARRRWLTHVHLVVDGLMPGTGLTIESGDSVTLQHYTYQWFPEYGIRLGAYNDFRLTEEERHLWDEVEDAPTDERHRSLMRAKNPNSSLYVAATCFAFPFDRFETAVTSSTTSE